jgi:hypothetical protein
LRTPALGKDGLPGWIPNGNMLRPRNSACRRTKSVFDEWQTSTYV